MNNARLWEKHTQHGLRLECTQDSNSLMDWLVRLVAFLGLDLGNTGVPRSRWPLAPTTASQYNLFAWMCTMLHSVTWSWHLVLHTITVVGFCWIKLSSVTFHCIKSSSITFHYMKLFSLPFQYIRSLYRCWLLLDKVIIRYIPSH